MDQNRPTTIEKALTELDSSVQEHYVAAEQAYGDQEFERAERIATALLATLEPLPDHGDERDAALAWRACIALLLGHIHFHGLHQPGPAARHYHLVLSSQPPDTLKQLALQGLERCRQVEAETTAAPMPQDHDAIHALIQDPFRPQSASDASPGQAVLISATPWLEASGTLPSAPTTTPATANPPEPAAAPITLDEAVKETLDNAGEETMNPRVDATVHDQAPIATTGHDAPPAEDAEDNTATNALTEDTPAPPTVIDLSPWLLRRLITTECSGRDHGLGSGPL